MYKLLVLVALLTEATSARSLMKSQLRRSPRFAGRIINGTETTIEENPHQISLQLKDYGHWCGGSIISKNWVLTAAHCLIDKNAEFMIVAGTADQFEGGSLHAISEIIRHPNFDSTKPASNGNDLALLRIRQSDEFKFDEKRQPVSLFSKSEEAKAGSIAVVTGWGETGNGYSDILNRLEIPMITKEKCNRLYENIGGIREGQICAAYENGGKDACAGDSGGPLTIDGRLAGIVSWGHGCAVASQPGVYTEVAYFRDWIKTNSGV